MGRVDDMTTSSNLSSQGLLLRLLRRREAEVTDPAFAPDCGVFSFEWRGAEPTPAKIDWCGFEFDVHLDSSRKHPSERQNPLPLTCAAAASLDLYRLETMLELSRFL
jgi:hypothetical protein